MADTDQTAAPTRLPSAWKALAVVLPFLILFWINLAHHTMFFDEVNAWGISAASPTLSKLFYYVHYEGHPWLWYFILWFPSRLTHDPVAMKWVEAAFGTAILLIIGLLSPFNMKQRALILSSYFLVWEYTVMCRMYSVMLLLALLYVMRRVRNRDGVIGCCILLGLAGNTDMTGVLLSSALLVEYTYSGWFCLPSIERKAHWKRWAAGWAIYAGLIGFAVATLWPSKEISWQSSGRLGSGMTAPIHVARAFTNMIASPWWPIAEDFPKHFWRMTPSVPHWLLLLVPFVLFAYWRTFRRDKNLLLLMGCTLGFGIAFADIVYEGHARNWGIAFIAFVVGLWIRGARADSEKDRQAGAWSGWTYALLAISTAAGLCALIGSWIHPFSQARETARWLEQNNRTGVSPTGLPDVSFASVAEEMQQPVYFLECGCMDTFKLFSKDRESIDEQEIPQRLNLALDRLGSSQVIFVFYRPMDDADLARLRSARLTAEPLVAFSGAEVKTDNYYLYGIKRLEP